MRADFDAATRQRRRGRRLHPRTCKRESGYLLDPHTACGVVAAEKVLATRHGTRTSCSPPPIPRSFPMPSQAITGARPALPPRLASLLTDPERITVLPNDLAAVQRFVVERAGASQGAAA